MAPSVLSDSSAGPQAKEPLCLPLHCSRCLFLIKSANQSALRSGRGACGAALGRAGDGRGWARGWISRGSGAECLKQAGRPRASLQSCQVAILITSRAALSKHNRQTPALPHAALEASTGSWPKLNGGGGGGQVWRCGQVWEHQTNREGWKRATCPVRTHATVVTQRFQR